MMLICKYWVQNISKLLRDLWCKRSRCSFVSASVGVQQKEPPLAGPLQPHMLFINSCYQFVIAVAIPNLS